MNVSGKETSPEDLEEESSELPFLVTHWLKGFAEQVGGRYETVPDETRQLAVSNIQQASHLLSKAFANLGAFGNFNRPTLTATPGLGTTASRNAFYEDYKRQWSRIPENHLDNLVKSSIAGTVLFTDVSQSAAPNLVEKAQEVARDENQNAKSVREKSDESKPSTIALVKRSALHPPALANAVPPSQSLPTNVQMKRHDGMCLSVTSKRDEVAKKASNAMRQLLDTRQKFKDQEREIATLKRSLGRQENLRQEFNFKRSRLSSALLGESALAALKAEYEDGLHNCNRAAATIERKLKEAERSFVILSQKLADATTNANEISGSFRALGMGFCDPLNGRFMRQRGSSSRGHIINNFVGRQVVGSSMGRATLPREGYMVGHERLTRKALLKSRLSHAITINTHLSYPVYCLRFDRSGRYFVTGADDYLVKVFFTGCNPSRRSTSLRSVGDRFRGAVLVCTLRGHAGVINDIDVSSDNCFIASASEDGDCRVWGLKDGCPVAILRGHVGGANMVSWSTSTPYRLVTSAHDGYARVWDIKEAALKRYGAVIRKRSEYCFELTSEEKSTAAERQRSSSENDVSLPPIPVRAAARESEQSVGTSQQPSLQVEARQNTTVPRQEAPQANNILLPGRFVANDNIDEGVRLLGKLQHGVSTDERMAGPGTRARRAAVKVICVARCPLGAHFATGADDGICRIWSDEDDLRVSKIDRRLSNSAFKSTANDSAVRRSPVSSHLLLTLKAHLSAITDLQYSNTGDRIMTASQKDGIVKIWSWDSDPVHAESTSESPQKGLRHILIKLVNPTSSDSQSVSRRRAVRGSSRGAQSKVSCDVAVWTRDDSKILTAQSELVKESGTEIHAGSQFLFLWNSKNGQCLLGIEGAHTSQCPVVLPHPTDSSIVCSGGADGLMKVWDLNTGDCLFSHKNKVEHGPVDPAEKGKSSGFLDGAFSSDGNSIVLTDDSGRVSIFDCCSLQTQSCEPPNWMMDQYFGNDYYDLFYDSNGYCSERGSELPPHLAPRGVRCKHSGAPYPHDVNHEFQRLVGPSPSPEESCRWHRELLRSMALLPLRKRISMPAIPNARRAQIIQEFDSQFTILVSSNGESISAHKDQGRRNRGIETETSRNGGNHTQSLRSTSRTSVALSNNFRWRDEVDMLAEEGNDDDEVDSSDDDFELPPQARDSKRSSHCSDDSEDEDLMDFEEEAPSMRMAARQTRQTPGAQAQRSSTRLRSRASRTYSEEDSDADVEYLSTNKEPTGPFSSDYRSHIFRLPSTGVVVARQWLRRVESDSSYNGSKTYSPQIGDSIVYIPKAQYGTIQNFPVLSPPWHSWPQEAVWPVVCCRIRNVRYRFPFVGCFGRKCSGSKCNSIVAILTLEVTGIPVLSQQRAFIWPDPTFVEPVKRHCFEISIFESQEVEYIIPFSLYVERVKRLEAAIHTTNTGGSVGLEVSSFYADPEEEGEDATLLRYRGKLINHANTSELCSDANLNNSGFRSLQVMWLDDVQQVTELSPWEVNVENSSNQTTVERPCLTEAEKKMVSGAVAKLLQDDPIRTYFYNPVDESHYADYGRMVEIPMNLNLVERRLQANYYSTRFSAAADVRLIRDNCIKYNGLNSTLSQVATEMYQKFEEDVLSVEERNDAEFYYSNNGSSEAEEAIHTPLAKSSVDSTSDKSALELLPLPQEHTSQRHRSSRSRSKNPRKVVNDAASLAASAAAKNDNSNTQDGSIPLKKGDSEETNLSMEQTLRARNGSQTQTSNPALVGDSRIPSEADANSLPSRRSLRLRISQPVEGNPQQQSPSTPTLRRSSRNTAMKSPIDSVPSACEDLGEATNTPQLPVRRSPRVATRVESKVESQLTGPSVPYVDRDSSNAGIASIGKVLEEVTCESENGSEDESSVDDEDSEGMTGSPTRNSPHEYAGTRKSLRRAASEAQKVVAASEDLPKPAANRRKTRQMQLMKRRVPHRGNSVRASKRRKVDYNDESASDEGFDSSDYEGDSVVSESSDEMVPERSAKPQPPRSSGSRRSSRLRSSVKKEQHYDESSASQHSESSSEKSVDCDDESCSEASHSPPKKQRRGTRHVKPATVSAKNQDEVEAWHEIAVHHITRVTLDILKEVREMDVDDVFENPVLETHPGIRVSYLKVVKLPMDFRTIQEERLPSYESIRELQEDLITTFQNCKDFNEKDSSLGIYAGNMMECLNDIFERVCKRYRIRPLRKK